MMDRVMVAVDDSGPALAARFGAQLEALDTGQRIEELPEALDWPCSGTVAIIH